MKINLEKGKVKCYERKTSECSAELGVSCLIMQKHHGHCAELDVCSISEKYLSCNKKENIGTLGRVGRKVSENAKCRIITQSWTSGVRLDVHGMSEKYSSRNIVPPTINPPVPVPTPVLLREEVSQHEDNIMLIYFWYMFIV